MTTNSSERNELGGTPVLGNQTFNHNKNTDTTKSHKTNTETNTHSHNVYITNHRPRPRQEHRRKSRWSVTKFLYQHVYLPIVWSPCWHWCSHQGGWMRSIIPLFVVR
ncbi:hypothetical protein L218DRAFT_299216 [Marasmius fiardii PR-910]|nr:hypothetical protein L218DRAFT_299216 [Marasmius fiardii PR-910]